MTPDSPTTDDTADGSDTPGTSAFGLTAPPEGVVAGENVPVENETDRIEDAVIERVANTLKAWEPYSGWSEEERREKARELIDRHREGA